MVAYEVGDAINARAATEGRWSSWRTTTGLAAQVYADGWSSWPGRKRSGVRDANGGPPNVPQLSPACPH